MTGRIKEFYVLPRHFATLLLRMRSQILTSWSGLNRSEWIFNHLLAGLLIAPLNLRHAICPILTRDLSADLLAFTVWSPPPRHRYSVAVVLLGRKHECLHSVWTFAPPMCQDDSAVHSEHQDPISLAVEMAAVNHSILALSRTGGVPNDIKTESLEDEWAAGGMEGGEGKRWATQAGRRFFLVNLTLSHSLPM